MPATLPTDSNLTTKITTDLNWVKNHLILLLVTALLVFGAVYFVDSLVSKRATAEDTKWQAILAEQHQQTISIQTQLSQDEAQWAQINAALLASNQKLAEAVSKRDVQVQQQIKQDATLSAQETADRISTIEGISASAENDNIILPLPLGHKVVTDLDLLPATQANLSDIKSQLDNETKIATNLQADVDEKQKLLDAMKSEITKQGEACTAQVNDLKAQARKSKLKWFGAGWVVGMISARLLGI